MTALSILLTCGAFLLLVPVAVLLAEVLLAVMGRRANPVAATRPRLAVLMPAHDEALVIEQAIRAVTAQLSGSDRLLVVADNCSDETAAIASRAGASVVERRDPTRRGKGYALDLGVRHLRADAPQVVVVIDADCIVSAGALDRVARACAQSDRPVQALYLMLAPAGAPLRLRVAQFAWIVKNHVRPLGLHNLGLPCQLMGTGMAFPWSVLDCATLATSHLVEDLTLGIALARTGTPPLFCPEALVTSTFPMSREGTQTQRLRWEHGHLGVILAEGPRLLLDSIRRVSPRLLAMALDLSVPPLALLVLLIAVVWLASVLLFWFTAAAFPLRMSSTVLAALALAVFLAWARYGRRILSLRDLAFSTLYAAAKVPIYAKFVVARQLDWVRSKRDRDST
jgi:cellulose synthase/poly-beta-1,6-N-acetylglucosamine synthase-like glycosyltransferase